MAAGVEDGDRVADESIRAMLPRISRAFAGAVATRIERDDTVATSEERHLELPLPRMHDHPCRQQQHDRPLGPERLPRDRYAVVGIGGRSTRDRFESTHGDNSYSSSGRRTAPTRR